MEVVIYVLCGILLAVPPAVWFGIRIGTLRERALWVARVKEVLGGRDG
jgi:hypothetical protein